MSTCSAWRTIITSRGAGGRRLKKRRASLTHTSGGILGVQASCEALLLINIKRFKRIPSPKVKKSAIFLMSDPYSPAFLRILLVGFPSSHRKAPKRRWAIKNLLFSFDNPIFCVIVYDIADIVQLEKSILPRRLRQEKFNVQRGIPEMRVMEASALFTAQCQPAVARIIQFHNSFQPEKLSCANEVSASKPL